MNRKGLIIAFVIAAVTGVIFALFPDIELQIARPFYEFIDVNHNVFSLRFYEPFAWVRDSALWFSALLVAPAVAALLIKLIHPRRKMPVSGRAVVFLISTLVLGPGLLVNVTLKGHWGRPRPVEVTQFEGTEHYVPWWDPRGECDKNCSFVSGDVAGAIWTMAPAALAPPQWRALAYGGSLALGAVIAALRVMQGGHFVSDVIFAGVFTFLIIWVVYGAIYRWRRTRLSDEAVERSLERFSASIAGLFGKRKSEL